MKLTNDILLELGFWGEGKDLLNNPAYRLKVPVKNKYGHHYHYEIQMVLGDYPEDNGNSGILSLYDRDIKDAHMVTEERDSNDKVDFVMWEDKEKGFRGGIKYINIPERTIPIAWSVTTLERLNAIYTGLTGNEPLRLRNKEQTVQVSDTEKK